MENKLETVTKLLQAAEQIRSSVNPEYRSSDGVTASRDKLSTLNETMKIISGYVPEARRLPFQYALTSCNRYCGVYCNLKRHLRGIKGQRPGVNHLITTLKEIMPMLGSKQAVPIRKAVSILEAMKN